MTILPKYKMVCPYLNYHGQIFVHKFLHSRMWNFEDVYFFWTVQRHFCFDRKWFPLVKSRAIMTTRVAMGNVNTLVRCPDQVIEGYRKAGIY